MRIRPLMRAVWRHDGGGSAASILNHEQLRPEETHDAFQLDCTGTGELDLALQVLLSLPLAFRLRVRLRRTCV